MRRLFRVSLRTLLILMTICCVVLAVWSTQIEPYRRQAAGMARVVELGGTPTVSNPKDTGWRRWLVEHAVGPNAYVKAIGVDVANVEFEAGGAEVLASFPFMTGLDLNRSNFSDADASTLSGAKRLEGIAMKRCEVGDEGLAVILHGKPKLKWLVLTGCPITDESIASIAALPLLEKAYLRWTLITDEGAERLRELRPECEVAHRSR